eukprot:1102346-Pyramimonas_sp.AAC.1
MVEVLARQADAKAPGAPTSADLVAAHRARRDERIAARMDARQATAHQVVPRRGSSFVLYA